MPDRAPAFLRRWLPWRWSRRSGEAATARRHHLASEQRFRALLESLPRVAVQGYDRDRRVIYWNEASVRLYGYAVEEAMGQRLEDLIIPDAMRQAVIEAHRAWIEEGRGIPLRGAGTASPQR